MGKKDLNIKRIPFFFNIEASALKFAETGKPPEEIQVLMTGKWNHPAYGPMIIEAADITEFKKNFDSGLRRDIPITEGHESFDEKPAVGWFKELIDKGDQGLWATMEWTAKGITLLQEKAYKYFSPEFYTEYEDPETREIYENVLVGGALTNKPYFKQMQAVVLSEKSINNNYRIFNDMDLQTILAKKIEDLTAEEKTFVKEHEAELTEEQKTTFASVLATAETEEEKKVREEKEAGDANEAAGLNRDGSAKELTQEEKDANVAAGKNEDGTEKVDASEKNTVKVSASEYQALKDMADKGAKAFAELRAKEIATEAKALIFSEQNSTGKIMPKDEAKLVGFLTGLNESQRKEFKELVSAIPSSKLFKEVGDGGDNSGSAAVELNAKVKEFMEKDKALKYSDALRLVLADPANKDLSARHASELAGK